ncbi:MAG: hypothetical protein JXQ29_14550 [Planctomycetes bacterium]|nr:hypothetical protein [Planctomycetota bacterium]
MSAKRTYSAADIAAALGVTPQQVRAWHRLVRPQGEEGEYSFRELVAFRTLKALKAAGLGRARIRAALDHLRRSFPSLDAPLASLCLHVEGREVIVDLERGAMTVQGQLLLELDAEEPRAVIVELGSRNAGRGVPGALAAELAQAHADLGRQLLRAGHALDARGELERALLYDPDFAPAYETLAEVFGALGCPQRATEYRALAAEKRGWSGGDPE